MTSGSETGPTAPARRLDRAFVVAATAIGGLYALIVVVLGAVAGKEAAGVAGVALTALATAIFKQFESLRFRQVADAERVDVAVPSIRWPRVAVFAMALFGLKFVAGMVLGVAGSLATGRSVGDLADWRHVLAIVGANVVAYAVGGFVIARAFRLERYATLLVAAFASIALDTLLPLAAVALLTPGVLREALAATANWPAAFWLAYLAVTLLGAKLANRRYPHGAPTPAATESPRRRG